MLGQELLQLLCACGDDDILPLWAVQDVLLLGGAQKEMAQAKFSRCYSVLEIIVIDPVQPQLVTISCDPGKPVRSMKARFNVSAAFELHV